MSLSPEDLVYLEELLKEKSYLASNLIEILHEVQVKYGYINKEIAKFLSEKLKIPFSKVYAVVTFYNEFKTTKSAKHTFKVCLGTACKVMKSQELIDFLRETLSLNEKNQTDDLFFGVDIVYCFGACSLAPVVEFDGKLYGKVTPEKLRELISSVKNDNH